jgi:dolichol kinase
MQHPQNNFKHEIKRKLFHLSSLWMVFVIYFFDKKISLTIFFTLSLLIFICEISRKYFTPLAKLYHKIFGKILRKHEENGALSGAFYMVVAAFICSLFFPKIIAATSLTVTLISDSCAALIGRKYGKHKILNKSLEGSIAFLLSAMLIISFSYDIYSNFIPILITSFLAMLIEIFSGKIKIDDNFTITLTTAILLTYLL